MKKTLSMILAIFMVLALVPATVAFAEEIEPAGTITAFQKVEDDYIQVEGTFTTIDTAANAAGVNGKIELSAGKFEFNGRQTIAVNGITLIGAVDATTGKPASDFVTGPNYASSSETNRKALFCVAATGVTVKNIAFDGGEYGRTLVPTSQAATQFSVVRINSGSAVFDNVSIVQSTRTLLTIGTSSNSASFTATNLYCDGNMKTVPTAFNSVYADIDVENGTFSCTSGELNAYLQVGSHGSVSDMPAYHYTFNRELLFISLVNVKTTVKHFVDSYNYIVAEGGDVYDDNIANFRTLVRSELDDAIPSIVNDMCSTPNHFGSAQINGFKTILNDAKTGATSGQSEKLGGFIARLNRLTPAN